ncbi:MAG TPA: hypothetical protein VNK96_08070 [Fimbriimonadales bacterium]|nr:hypothetical protein [Fimbriimonadales bacterium]
MIVTCIFSVILFLVGCIDGHATMESSRKAPNVRQELMVPEQGTIQKDAFFTDIKSGVRKDYKVPSWAVPESGTFERKGSTNRVQLIFKEKLPTASEDRFCVEVFFSTKHVLLAPVFGLVYKTHPTLSAPGAAIFDHSPNLRFITPVRMKLSGNTLILEWDRTGVGYEEEPVTLVNVYYLPKWVDFHRARGIMFRRFLEPKDDIPAKALEPVRYIEPEPLTRASK